MHEEVLDNNRIDHVFDIINIILQIVLCFGWVYWAIDAINNQQWAWVAVSLAFAVFELVGAIKSLFKIWSKSRNQREEV